MQVVLITIAGYALTVVFATTSVILANSLRHRRRELDSAVALQEAATSELIESRSLANHTKEQLKSCRDASTMLKAKSELLIEVQDRLRETRKQLKGAYKRDGKRFVKIS